MLSLKKCHIDQIVAHVRAEAPLEAAGLLAGHASTVERVYCTGNADQSETTYLLDPEEQYRIFVEIEERGLELIGIFHSHPKSPAFPSPRDVDMAYYPEVVYLIVSLMDSETPKMRAFRIQGEMITEQPIEVLPEEDADCS